MEASLPRPSEATSFPLLALADELILSIIEQIDSREDLNSLATTCSRLQDLTEPYIWQSLLVLTGEHASALTQAFESRPGRMSSVQEMAICYNEDNEDGIEYLSPCIPHMRKLRQLRIETPCPNNHGGLRYRPFNSPSRIDYTSLFQSSISGVTPYPPLSMLTSFTLHGHRSVDKPFSFGRASAIFLHPMLQYLNISCINFEDDFDFDIPTNKLKSTPLRTLVLTECHVYLSFLEIALSLPKALRELSINERLYTWDGCSLHPGKPRTLHPQFLDILQNQASSLERLTHNPGSNLWPPVDMNATSASDAIKLLNLESLRHLQVTGTSPITFALREGGHPVDLELLRVDDSAFSVLQAYDATIGYDHLLELAHTLAVKCTAKPLNVDIVFTVRGKPAQASPGWWFSQTGNGPRRRMAVYKIATILKARGARLRIFIEHFATPETHFIPPYLYGEETPQEYCAYSSDNLWSFRWMSRQAWLDCQISDQWKIPQELRVTCTECAKSGNFCENGGYGSSCALCAESGHICEYPPIHSPWAIQDVNSN